MIDLNVDDFLTSNFKTCDVDLYRILPNRDEFNLIINDSVKVASYGVHREVSEIAKLIDLGLFKERLEESYDVWFNQGDLSEIKVTRFLKFSDKEDYYAIRQIDSRPINSYVKVVVTLSRWRPELVHYSGPLLDVYKTFQPVVSKLSQFEIYLGDPTNNWLFENVKPPYGTLKFTHFRKYGKFKGRIKRQILEGEIAFVGEGAGDAAAKMDFIAIDWIGQKAQADSGLIILSIGNAIDLSALINQREELRIVRKLEIVRDIIYPITSDDKFIKEADVVTLNASGKQIYPPIPGGT